MNFGDEPPLIADKRRKPERRQVSARWLAGTLLTGVTSSALMGVALAAALDGHRIPLKPSTGSTSLAVLAAKAPVKGERLVTATVPLLRSRETIELSTMTRDGDREVIRTLPFGYVNMALGARHPITIAYPPFDAFAVLNDDGAASEPDDPDGAQIYGDKVESEMSLKVEPFSFEHADFDEIPTEDAEALVRQEAPTLAYDPVQVASIEAFDPSRLSDGSETSVYEPGSAFRIVAENVSVTPKTSDPDASRYSEEIIPFREAQLILKTLVDNGFNGPETGEAATVLGDLLGTHLLNAGNVLRVGSQGNGGGKRIVRLSAYSGTLHMATVAASDDGRFASAAEPTLNAAVAEAFDENATEAPLRTDMPTVYDGVYQAALAYGLNERMCRQLIRMLASDVDLQAHASPDDHLVVFFSMDEGEDTATDTSQILYVEADLGDHSQRYYRFRGTGDGHYDYYDPDGRSAKQFLLRSPVPNGRFTSPFGVRFHPVLGYSRPHWGVDWAAPSGTPILASGDGVVESAGWTSGYGRQTVLRHANGYETSYSHQSAIARGVKPGATVRQGQVIGTVGTSGLSTGNHLHYEVVVNGQKVDPMRIKLPSGRVLQGEELETFRRERDRIDALLKDRAAAQKVAAR